MSNKGNMAPPLTQCQLLVGLHFISYTVGGPARKLGATRVILLRLRNFINDSITILLRCTNVTPFSSRYPGWSGWSRRGRWYLSSTMTMLVRALLVSCHCHCNVIQIPFFNFHSMNSNSFSSVVLSPVHVSLIW